MAQGAENEPTLGLGAPYIFFARARILFIWLENTVCIDIDVHICSNMFNTKTGYVHWHTGKCIYMPYDACTFKAGTARRDFALSVGIAPSVREHPVTKAWYTARYI